MKPVYCILCGKKKDECTCKKVQTVTKPVKKGKSINK